MAASWLGDVYIYIPLLRFYRLRLRLTPFNHYALYAFYALGVLFSVIKGPRKRYAVMVATTASLNLRGNSDHSDSASEARPLHTFCKVPQLREIKPPRIERIEQRIKAETFGTWGPTQRSPPLCAQQLQCAYGYCTKHGSSKCCSNQGLSIQWKYSTLEVRTVCHIFIQIWYTVQQ